VDKKKISVVIPCYNEEKVIVNTINTIRRFFFRHRDKFIYELIFVDDGSNDKTTHLLNVETYDKRNEKLIRYIKNRGKGYAVRTGLLNAKYDTILILDADLSVKIDNLLKVTLWDNAVILSISKRIQVEKQPFYRIFAGFCFRWLVKIMFLMPYSDTQCPLKVLHNIPKKFINELKIDGFSYDVELIHKARQQSIPISEYEVEYFNNEDSSVTLKKTIKMFLELLRIRIIQ